MDDMDRRDFVKALGGLGLAAGLSHATIADAATGDALLASEIVQPGVKVRRNVYCLTDTSATLNAYRAGITAMKARPASNGTSWLAQANIHGASAAPAGMIANACRHDQQFFLSWHRMYLYFFEKIVRASSGDPNFALPYWGYSPTGNRNLPAPFRTPAAATNPLYAAARRATINTGSNLAASSVDPGNAMLELGFGGFTNQINGTPHGVVHTGVGGPGGLMSAFETAGQDPIFWLHHCQIDRLWELWLQSGGGRVNPTTDSAWMTQNFNFYDDNGATVQLSGSQIVDTASQLNYRYGLASCLMILRPDLIVTRIPRFDPRIIEILRGIRVRPPRPGPPPPPIAQAAAIRLGAAAAGVRLPVSREQTQVLSRFPNDARAGNELNVVLSGVQVEGNPDVYYEVYVNLPANADTSYTSQHYVGNLDFFGPSPRSGRRPHDRTLSLLPAYARLRNAGRWRDSELQLTFVPRGYVEGSSPRQLLGARSQARIDRISVQMK